MKSVITALTTIFCLSVLTLGAHAITFVDEMEVVSSGIRQTNNLQPRQRSGLPEARDQMQLTVAAEQNRGVGAVRYRVSGLENVRFRVYTPRGTFATAGGQALRFGAPDGNMPNPFASPPEAIDVFFSPNSQGIYARHQGEWHQLIGSDYNHDFVRIQHEPDARTRLPMGVRAYGAASAGGTPVPIQLRRERIAQVQLAEDGRIMIAEDFVSAGAMPSNTAFLWIELNDPGGNVLTRSADRTSLAWVELTGRSLRMGEPPPAPPVQPPGTELPPDPDPAPPPRPPARPSTQPPSSSSNTNTAQEAATRFAGVITAPNPNAGGAPAAPPPAERNTPPVPPPQGEAGRPAPPIAQLPDPLAIYEVSREPETSGNLSGVGLYIAGVAGLAGYLLLKPKFRQK
ncbi:MAG: hypothetical protein FWE32_02980 [Oscillospiraceae bacterium]|nr:hypothetical protein [Oscillospiraceae bacterium]